MLDAGSDVSFDGRDGPADGWGDASVDDDAIDGETPDAFDASFEDVEHDASRVTLDCLGERRPLVISRDLPFMEVSVGTSASRGLFLLDLATTLSVIDMAAFDPAPIATGCNPDLLFEDCGFSDFEFFGSWGPVTLVTQNLAGLGGVREAGIVGTDFMSQMILTFDYANEEVARAQTLCSDAELEGAGYTPISTAGFYSNSFSNLRPLQDVVSSASPGITVPNVPTVPARIGDTQMNVQLDTGFDDSLVPRSINVNEAFFTRLQAAIPGALTRDAGNDVALSTCAGVAESVEAWRVSEPLRFDTLAGAPIELDDVVLFVKRTPAAAQRCGGIGTWDAPAGQLAASLHAALRELIVDPYTSRVWVRR